MARRKHSPERVINKLRQAEVAIAEGCTVAEASRQIGVTQQTFYRWRSEYGGLRIDQARRLRQLEAENTRLKRAVADLTVDNQILKEAAEGIPAAASAWDTSSRPWMSQRDVPAGSSVIPGPPSATSQSLRTTRGI